MCCVLIRLKKKGIKGEAGANGPAWFFLKKNKKNAFFSFCFIKEKVMWVFGLLDPMFQKMLSS